MDDGCRPEADGGRGIGRSSVRIPPRRTGTVTETRGLASMCFAFQLFGSTARYSRPPVDLKLMPLERGSPAGVT